MMSDSISNLPKYSEMPLYVKSTECSHDSALSMAVLLGDLQEASDKGAQDCGFDRTVINSLNACWIILRMRVHIDRLPLWRENFVIQTWSVGREKFYYDREYKILDSDNNVIGYGSSLWILADYGNHRPLNPSKIEGLPSEFSQNDELVFNERCKRSSNIKKTEFDGINPVIVKYADYSELDHNHHVNNTRYMAWAYDALYKAGYDVSGIKDFSLSYISEVLPGEKVELYIKASETDSKILVSAYKNEDINVFDAEIFLS